MSVVNYSSRCVVLKDILHSIYEKQNSILKLTTLIPTYNCELLSKLQELQNTTFKKVPRCSLKIKPRQMKIAENIQIPLYKGNGPIVIGNR